MNVEVILKDGKIYEKKLMSFDWLCNDLRKQREYLHALSINDLVGFFNDLVDYWTKKKVLKNAVYSKNLLDFWSKINLEPSLGFALRGDLKVLDEFRDLGDKKFLFHAQPRGLTVQWLAGNVAVLGLFSIFSALITKNICLVKASSHNFKNLIDILETMGRVVNKKICGKELLKSVAVILVENSDKKIHEVLSQNADVRIAWGGRQAIAEISSLAKKPFCEDIIFGPKYSYAVIDKTSLDENFANLAQKLAVDVSVFDQYACSSPHTVFVEEGGKFSAKDFARELAKKMDLVGRTLLPKDLITPSGAARILETRSEYLLKGEVWQSSGTEWTVIYSEEKNLFSGCSSRVIRISPIKDLKEISDLNDRQKQTMGVAMTLKNKLKYLDAITFNGIDRCPDFGNMTFFESPWDGMFVFDRLVRWVTTYKK